MMRILESIEEYRIMWNDHLECHLNPLWSELDFETIDLLIIENYLQVYKLDCKIAGLKMQDDDF
jgi:hypothetical protein